MSEKSIPAVEAKGLCRRYGRSWALVDVDLRAEAGQAILLAGRNGSGKSTLLRVLAGALKPDRGALLVNGVDGLRDRQALRQRVALLGHASYTYDALSALQNLQVVARMLGRPSGRRDLLPLLEEVGIDSRADDPVHAYSAGMRRRLAFARLLLQDPDIVLLDEPYAQLDPPGFRFVDTLIPRLTAAGKTVIVASHHLEEGARLCHVGLALERGRLAWKGLASELPSSFGGLSIPGQVA
ncbi:heme ABC exporter ATP-binding protein CcmA [Vulgatibacter incomptus]|uniref:ABC transporter involved in cytochrome c biogenesis, ATPase component CcmA n=1 Tax=Vulgatibacter incomptus TaxID=1391653 RepID=A0A0K1P8H7_9BACT|nr:heme ABC exporter ATP-binding protein CcmA [Vulgatibacter incomptus]AKU89825.1 ABC transporter involved in cytochrome c biogenesis, ATPase component CcmA [Vulgatibacter incomptus]